MSSDSASSEELDSPKAAPASPNYVLGPEEPEQAPLSPDYVPGPEYPEYLALSDLEEDSEDGPVDYPAEGDDSDDDDSFDDDKEEEEPLEEEEDEHLAEPFETDESAATPPSPSAYYTTSRIFIRPKAPMPFPSEEEVERLLALPPSPLISLLPPFAKERLVRCLAAPAPPSSPLPIAPHPYGTLNHVRAPQGFRAAMASLFIPPPVDHKEDTPEAELPPRKRLCLTALTSRYEVRESSTAALRPTGGHGIDYGFISTLDAKTRR
ncbi:hypothetical protein Tco_1473504 [Tanacetum coccineum]